MSLQYCRYLVFNYFNMNLLNFTKGKRVNCGWILAFFSSLILLGSGCSKEEYDLENLSTDSLLIKTALAAPIGSVKMRLNDIVRHKGISGKIVSDDIDINLAEILELALPLKCSFGTHITGYDTITGINLNEYLGESNMIDSLHVAALNFEIENQFPLNSIIKIVFMTEEDILGMPFYQDLAAPDLNIQIDIPKAKSLSNPSDPISSTTVNREIKVKGDAQADLMKATAMRIEYELILGDGETCYLVENQFLKLDISAYLKADVLLND